MHVQQKKTAAESIGTASAGRITGSGCCFARYLGGHFSGNFGADGGSFPGLQGMPDRNETTPASRA